MRCSRVACLLLLQRFRGGMHVEHKGVCVPLPSAWQTALGHQAFNSCFEVRGTRE